MGKLANAGQHNPSNPASDYEIVNWYSRPWNAVLRPTNEKLAELSANMAIAAANNNNIIYIWGGQTYHQQLAANNNDPSAIKVQCGTDCMGTVFANIKGAMRRLGMNDSVLPNMGTSNADALLKVGYQKFTDSDHVNTDAHAKEGRVRKLLPARSYARWGWKLKRILHWNGFKFRFNLCNGQHSN